MLGTIRRLALPIAITSLVVNVVITVVGIALWVIALMTGLIDSVAFIAHISLLALVFAGVSGLAGAVAGILALVPTDDIVEAVMGDET